MSCVKQPRLDEKILTWYGLRNVKASVSGYFKGRFTRMFEATASRKTLQSCLKRRTSMSFTPKHLRWAALVEYPRSMSFTTFKFSLLLKSISFNLVLAKTSLFTNLFIYDLREFTKLPCRKSWGNQTETPLKRVPNHRPKKWKMLILQ